RMLDAQRLALRDFSRVVSEAAPESLESIAALHKLRKSLAWTPWLFEVDRTLIRTRIRELNSELAQRLLKHFGRSEHADNYLVRGFVISTNLDGAWTVQYPTYEVPLGIEQFGTELILNVPSAFHLFVSDGDWLGAQEIIEARPEAF